MIPKGSIPDVKARVSDERMQKRMESLSVVEKAFAAGRLPNLDQQRRRCTSSPSSGRGR
jgi:hypothetical protein